MDKTQTARYEMALARATENNLSVCYVTSSNPTGAGGAPIYPVYMVNSGSRPGVFYAVTQRGKSLACSCEAAEKLLYCQHRATATAFIIGQATIARKDARHADDTKRANEVIGQLDTLTSSEIEDPDRDRDVEEKHAAWSDDARLYRK